MYVGSGDRAFSLVFIITLLLALIAYFRVYTRKGGDSIMCSPHLLWLK